MSVLEQIHERNINHAIVRNEADGFVDWFIVCRKSHMRAVYYTPTGTYVHNRVQIYEIDMNRSDVHYFYESVHRGMYKIVYRELEGIVWELNSESFKDYVKKVPMRKNKKL